MTFTIIDTSRTKGSPFLLLLFRYGVEADQIEAYTNNETPIVFAGNTYQPVPLDTDAIRARGVNGKNEFTVRLPNDTAISKLFRFFPPPAPVGLTIYQGHRTDEDGEFPVVWTGRVLSAKPGSGLETTFSCEWVAVGIRRSGATRNWQYSCPHALYGSVCRANKVAATTSTQVVSVSGLKITLTPGWVSDTLYPKYANGMVSWETPSGREYRSIMEISGSGVIQLSNRASGLTQGATVEVSYGCNRLTSDCRDLHSNIHNYGGQPWIPLVNPINRDNY